MFDQPLALVAGGNPAIVRLAAATLAGANLRTDVARSGDQARQLVEDLRPDLVVVADSLPDLEPLELVAEIRTRSAVPILLLGDSNAPGDAVTCLDSGADDYVPVPFHPDELLARARAVLRRAQPAHPAHIVRLGDLDVDLDRRVLTSSGDLVRLSRREWLLLEALARNIGSPVSREDLLTAGWGPESAARQVLRVSIGRLRRKLGTPAGREGPLRTLPGGRYVLDPAWRPA